MEAENFTIKNNQFLDCDIFGIILGQDDGFSTKGTQNVIEDNIIHCCKTTSGYAARTRRQRTGQPHHHPPQRIPRHRHHRPRRLPRRHPHLRQHRQHPHHLESHLLARRNAELAQFKPSAATGLRPPPTTLVHSRPSLGAVGSVWGPPSVGREENV